MFQHQEPGSLMGFGRLDPSGSSEERPHPASLLASGWDQYFVSV